ncbi:MAG: HDOD domain-containing protein [Spirochaetaceae bacterium]|jgi:hypothetical protein|nr:HDOD domain-containing protein [Spirochaetaceae bacterium]
MSAKIAERKPSVLTEKKTVPVGISATNAIFYTSAKVKLVCDTAKTTAIDLFRVISTDPYLAYLTIKLFHLYFPAQSKKYVSIEHIIVALNLNTVKNTVLSAAEISAQDKKRTDIPVNSTQEDFWRHSVASAVFARLLAKERGIEDSLLEEYWFAALLHDVGKHFLLYTKTAKTLRPDHCAAGFAAGKAAGFAASLCDVILFHHSFGTYNGVHKDLICNTILSDYFVNKSGFLFEGKKNAKPEASVLKQLGLTQESMEVMFGKINKTFLLQLKKINSYIKSKTEVN